MLNDVPSPATPPAAVVHHLAAGPVRLKYQDGELRYLCVGPKEIARRIYFAVRDEHWDTVMPEFTTQVIEKTADSFTIRLAATCRNAVSDFAWSGTITGTPAGTITFTVEGGPERDFTSPRCGLNVLFGSESLAGQPYTLTNHDDQATAGAFPRLVAHELLATRFAALDYQWADCGVRIALAPGSTFGMEDQRNYGDSSYKAFSGLALPYPAIKKGQHGNQTLVLEVTGKAPAAAAAPPPALLTGRLPRLVPVPREKAPSFEPLNHDAPALAGKQWITFGFTPALHMPDNDTFMENATAILDQVRTLRAAAPKAKFRIAPVGFDSPYPRHGPDPRHQTAFAAAWTVRMVKYLALAGVDEAAFAVAPVVAGPVLDKLRDAAGRPVAGTVMQPGLSATAVETFVIGGAGQSVMWLANLQDQPCLQVVSAAAFAGAGSTVRVERLVPDAAGRAAAWQTATILPIDGQLSIELPPFGVAVVSGQP